MVAGHREAAEEADRDDDDDGQEVAEAPGVDGKGLVKKNNRWSLKVSSFLSHTLPLLLPLTITEAAAADDSNSKRLDSDSSAIAAATAINIEKEHMFLFFELLTGEIGVSYH
ncbi:hypothetical protein CCACVL1_29301 [Corchorus capsularis]|uniref:Uncharacterized protein n=1 Tax=Corchorus capsularis TaxID=210143 RepID=A0A1R3G2D6_COCAP|nr:hypothetical protein CCACVL1_29301 [Corchorus capsularis]